MPIQINNVTRRVVYAASGTGPYAFTFEILAAGDIAVYKDDTLLTITTDYTVSINSNGTGSITLTAAPTGATQIAIVGNRTIQRTTDFTTGGDFFANTLNDELDQQTIFAQQNAEGLSRALQAPQTDPTTVNMTLPRASLRANKALGFDANGNPVIADTLGTNRGNWSASVLYYVRDIVKDTTNNNIWQCITQHTSSGSQPINTNADSAKWTLLVDAAAASTSATNAANSATAAASSASAASTSATNAASSASSASTSASNASTSATNAASSASTASGHVTTASEWATKTTGQVASTDYSSKAWAIGGTGVTDTASRGAAKEWATKTGGTVDGTEYSAKHYSSAASTSATNAASSASSASSSASAASSSASSASTSASNASTSATNASNSASSASTSATNAASSASAAATSATNAANSASAAATSETNAASSATAAAASYDSFDDRYLGSKTANPSVDNDGNALITGAIYFNSVAAEMRVYNGSTWQTIATLPDLVVEQEFTATAGQTSYTFTGGYRVGFVYVWVNGVMLSDADITATNGSTITFGTALTLNDEVRVITFKAVGSVTATDVGALPLTGGTVTGPTVVSVNSSSDALRITQTGAGNALVVEDSTNPDSTPFVVDASGIVIVGNTTQVAGAVTGAFQVQGSGANGSSANLQAYSTSTGGTLEFDRSRGSLGTHTVVNSGDRLGRIFFNGSDGTAFIRGAEIYADVDGTPGTNDMPGRLVFSTTADGASSPTERMRITNGGFVGIGATPTRTNLLVGSNITSNSTSTNGEGVRVQGIIQNDVTNIARGFISTPSQASGATLTSLYYFEAQQGTISGTVTNQMGFVATSNLTGATNNYGFYSDVASGTGRWNFYANGTAENYLGGNLKIGGTAARATTAGTNHLSIFNGTAPAGTLTNGITLYSASGDFNFMDSSGNGYKVGYRNIPAVGTKTGSYTLAVGDVGKYVQVGSGGSITIPDATFAEGDVVSVFNNTAGNITITCSITTAYIAGTDSDKASVTLATRGVATILFISGTVCVISGNVT